MRHGSLFSGIGGFDLAAEWCGWENSFHCEINPIPARVLNYYWPNAKSYDDITKTDFSIWRGRVDILTGGFPCQPFSTAGKRGGVDDHRYLWPEYLRAIREIKPVAVVGENVSGLLSMEQREMFARVDSRRIVRFENYDDYEAVYTRQSTLLVNDICEDLEKEGYDVQTFIIPAAGVGAPHQRDRIWFVAYSENNGFGRRTEHRKKNSKGKRNIQEHTNQGRDDIRSQFERFGAQQIVAHPTMFQRDTEREESVQRGTRGGVWGISERDVEQKPTSDTTSLRGIQINQESESRLPHGAPGEGDAPNSSNTRLQGGEQRETFDKGNESRKSHGSITQCNKIPNWEQFPTQYPVCGGDDGFPSGLDGITIPAHRRESLKAYGNAIVPQVAHRIFQAIDLHFKNF